MAAAKRKNMRQLSIAKRLNEDKVSHELKHRRGRHRYRPAAKISLVCSSAETTERDNLVVETETVAQSADVRAPKVRAPLTLNKQYRLFLHPGWTCQEIFDKIFFIAEKKRH